MQLIQTVAPLKEPLTLAEAKEFLRVLDDDSDNDILTTIAEVIESIEEYTARQLMTATFEVFTEDFIVKLPKNPIQSISKIEYMDENCDYIELDNTTYYLYERFGIGCVNYSIIPNYKEHKKAIKITIVCGYIDVPKPIIRYIKVKLSTWMELKEDEVLGISISKVEGYTENLISPYKIRSI